MNREEILEKNKKDNCIFDEMNVYNTRVENENAYLCLKIILIILYITFSVLEKFYTYLNPTKYLFSFLLFSGLTVQMLTRYKFNKKILNLIISIFFIVIIVISVWRFFIEIWGFYEWRVDFKK